MTQTDIQIRFNDVDQMGHVNNAVIMEYLDLGKEEFFAARGLPPEAGDFTVVIVHYEVDFSRQIRFHDAVRVETGVERIGNRSLTLMQRVVERGEGGGVYCTCRTVMSGYRRSTGASAPIPDDVRQRLQR